MAQILMPAAVCVLQLNHLRCLHDFAEAQATYYAQCHHYMQDLQRELGRCANPAAAAAASSSHSALSVEQAQLAVTGTRKAKVLYDYDGHDTSELSLLADEVRAHGRAGVHVSAPPALSASAFGSWPLPRQPNQAHVPSAGTMVGLSPYPVPFQRCPPSDWLIRARDCCIFLGLQSHMLEP